MIAPIDTQRMKIYGIAAGILLLLFIAAGIYFYRKGKKQTVIAPLVKDTPGSDDPNNNPAAASDTEIKRISEALYSDMNGFNLYHGDQPYEDLLMLSDTDFERVYNQFNSEYQQDSGQTLKAWLDSEEVNLWDPSFGSLRDSIDSRMVKLNLI